MENTQYTAAPPNTDKALYWYSILVKCARLLDLPDDEPIPSGVLRKVEELAALAPAAPAPAGPEPGTWDYLIEELESGRTAGRIAAMKSKNAVLVAAKARIADLEAALRSVLDQPETAAAYDTMMQRATEALAGTAPVQAELCTSLAPAQAERKPAICPACKEHSLAFGHCSNCWHSTASCL